MAKNRDEEKFVVLDVTRPKGFEKLHLENAVNLDFFSKDFKTRLKVLDKIKTYLLPVINLPDFICQSPETAQEGIRSIISLAAAAGKLKQENGLLKNFLAGALECLFFNNTLHPGNSAHKFVVVV